MSYFQQKQAELDECASVTVDPDEIIKWVRKHCRPADVFSDDELSDWAGENDFVRRD